MQRFTITTQPTRDTLVKIAWIDASHPMANRELWGLTLLERNLRQLSRLGIEEATVLTTAASAPKQHFIHPLPDKLKIILARRDEADPFKSIRDCLEKRSRPILILEGNAIYDDRVLKELTCSVSSLVVTFGGNHNSVGEAGAAVLFDRDSNLFRTNGSHGVSTIFRKAVQSSEIPRLDLSRMDSYIPGLRAHVPPYVRLIEGPGQLQDSGDLLKQTVHKGVNDFVAKYIHPPLEFAGARLLARTKVTPNQVTVLGIVLSIVTTYLFVTGNLLPGAILAAIKGVLDGIDGKLARLTLRFSKYGERLDHVGDTIFDGLWYLALGWHFSGGDINSTATQFAMILFVSYVVERIIPGIFKKLHGSEIYDYGRVDRVIRLIGSRINNNIWVFVLAIILGVAREAFYGISIWMLATASWHAVRLLYVTLRKRGQRALAN